LPLVLQKGSRLAVVSLLAGFFCFLLKFETRRPSKVTQIKRTPGQEQVKQKQLNENEIDT